jgi:hypothetical protein
MLCLQVPAQFVHFAPYILVGDRSTGTPASSFCFPCRGLPRRHPQVPSFRAVRRVLLDVDVGFSVRIDLLGDYISQHQLGGVGHSRQRRRYGPCVILSTEHAHASFALPLPLLRQTQRVYTTRVLRGGDARGPRATAGRGARAACVPVHVYAYVHVHELVRTRIMNEHL